VFVYITNSARSMNFCLWQFSGVPRQTGFAINGLGYKFMGLATNGFGYKWVGLQIYGLGIK